MGRHRRGVPGTWLQLRLRMGGAVLLAVSSGIHLDLYLTGYRSIPTIGWLFLVQIIAGFVLAAAALVTRGWLAAAASAGLALSTLGAYLLAVWIGLFGFREVRTRAGLAAGLVEVAAFAMLAMAATGARAMGHAGEPSGPGAPGGPGGGMLARVRAAVPVVVGAVGAVSVAALALLGVAVANVSGPSAAAAGAGMTLKTGKVGGVAVLTNADGFTLYWFALDSPAASRCTGSCAAYWPPVTGNPGAGPGVTGQVGTIKRPGGGRQVTYNGHPLYTYVGDSGPGQARGDNLDLNGGLWYEVRLPG